MSAPRWKPGDVAMVRFVNGASEHRAMRDADGKGWGVVSHGGSLEVADARPLVVIDPEDREQVERLLTRYLSEYDGMDSRAQKGEVDCFQIALRSLVTDPKPEEPQGLGAVVEDAEGRRYVRTAVGETLPWVGAGWSARQGWSSLAVARVISEGVAR